MFFVFYTEEWIFQKYGIKIKQIMPHLTLTDNNIANPSSLSSLLQNDVESQIHAFQDLQTIAGKSLQELCKQNANLLVFPDCLKSGDDKIEELSICELAGSPKYSDESKIENVDNVKIKTGNLMGFVGFGGKDNHGTLVEIRSRFTKNNKQDHFLHYMLEKVFRINLFNLNYSHSRNDGLDLLYLVFPYFLKKALRQGLLRKYQTYKRNDSAVKGVIDISRHIKYNTPFNGKIAYNYREYSADNHVTQLIRHTIEFLKQKPIGKNILSNDSDIMLAVKQIAEVTQETYSFHAREKIIHKNLKGENHPYYSDYKPLQKLCMMILNHSKMQYSQSNSPVYGILFDGAWLWEEYLATILCDPKLAEKQFLHPTNKDRKGGIRLFDNTISDEDSSVRNCYRRIYPDFYRENTKPENDDFLKNDGVILVAKYKQLDKGLVRDDLYQIISYMHTMKIPNGGFIYPDSSTVLTDRSDEDEILLPSEVKTRLQSDVEVKTFHLAGLGGTIRTIAFPITQNAENYELFKTQMQKAESELTSKLV